MRVSPSAVLRGTRLWNKPGDHRSPCLSQNATRMERLLRSVSPPHQSYVMLNLLLSLQSNIETSSCLYAVIIFKRDVRFCLCRSSVTLWQATAGVSQVTASQWAAPLCTTGPRCVQVLVGKRPEDLWMKCPELNNLKTFLPYKVAGALRLRCQHSLHLSCLGAH